MTEEVEELVRVSMQWPKELKERVREHAGHRGMTEFVIDAVLERLGPEPEVEEEPTHVRCPEHKTMHPVGAVCPQCRLESRAQEEEAEKGPAPVAPSGEETSIPLQVESGDDHLAKVMAMAREKGVELGSLKLTPASEIPKPEPKTDWIADPETSPEEKLEHFESLDPVSTSGPAEIATEDKCSTCGSELIDGECWTCE